MQLTEKQKYEIIILREHNYKINEIADKMKINRITVMKWIKNYGKNKNIERKEGSGRKKITSFNDDNFIIELVKKDNDVSIKDIKNKLEDNNILISKSTIHRRLIENDYSYKFPIKKPFLTENHRKNRLEWANEHINTDWNKIIFSDECAIRINGFNKKKWIHKDDIIIDRTFKYPLKKTFGDVFFKIILDLLIFLRII